ncbi:MAG: rRNA maturation RNase YbeY [Holosporaceae bacterium]
MRITNPKAWHALFVPTKAWLQQILNACNAAVPCKQKATVSFLFTSKRTIQQYNARYRHQDKPTNVLSFPLEAPAIDGQNTLLGDVIVALEVIKDEACDLERPFKDHLTHMLVHGILHLRGFDHIEKAEAIQMQKLESDILERLGINDPCHETL